MHLKEPMPFPPLRRLADKLLILAFAAMVSLSQLPALAGPVCLATPPHGGIGGTGHLAGGMGGTGLPAESGVGGTGAVAGDGGGIGGTGIVGTITGFASICVNGLEVHYDNATPASVNGRPASLDGLAVGQVVAIDAFATERGLVARHIRMINPLEGPITAIDPARGQLQVMGRNVILAPGLAKKLNGLAVGKTIQVSGLVNPAGHLVASRIQAKPDLVRSSLIGPVTAGKVQGVAVQGALPKDAEPSEVLAAGHWNGSRLVADEIRMDPVLPDRVRLKQAVVEGYPQRDPAGRFMLDGFELTGPKAAMPLPDRPVVVSGSVTDGHRLSVEKVEAAPRPVTDATLPGPARGNPAGSAADGHAHENSLADDDSDSGTMRATTTLLDSETDAATSTHRKTAERPERSERLERAERPETVERLDKVEKPEVAERPEKIEKPEKIERPEKVERPEKIERPEKVERPEQVEKPEMVERD